jgi:hypothetical protein
VLFVRRLLRLVARQHARPVLELRQRRLLELRPGHRLAVLRDLPRQSLAHVGVLVIDLVELHLQIVQHLLVVLDDVAECHECAVRLVLHR